MPLVVLQQLDVWIAFGLGAGIAMIAMAVWHLVSLRRVLAERTAKLSCLIDERDSTLAEMKANFELLRQQTNRDPLTGTANRRFLDDMLDQEWRRARRGGTSVSLVMLDVDHFKSYNDAYGHLAGDECLRRVAQAASDALLRPADLIARYGGEEFVIVLPDTSLKGAKTVAQNVSDAIAALDIPHMRNGDFDRVSVSSGVATLMPSEGGVIEDLLDAADRLLYDAKNAGRNQIRVQTDEVPSCRPAFQVIDGSKTV